MNKPNHLTKPLKHIALFVAIASASNFAQSAVTLSVDENIKVTAINGQAVNRSPLSNPKMSYALQPGKHVITAKYDRLYDLNRNKHDYLRSGNITVTVDLQDNQTYRLAMPNQPEEYRDAKKFAKNPTLAVMLGTQVIASQSSQIDSGSLLSGLNGRLFGGGAVNSNTQAIAAINQSAPVAATTTTSQGQSLNISGGSTLDNFMQIWLNATPAEREKIRSWISK